MSKVGILDPAADEPVNYKAAVVEYMAKIDSLMEKVAEDHKETDLLKAETKEILERLNAA